MNPLQPQSLVLRTLLCGLRPRPLRGPSGLILPEVLAPPSRFGVHLLCIPKTPDELSTPKRRNRPRWLFPLKFFAYVKWPEPGFSARLEYFQPGQRADSCIPPLYDPLDRHSSGTPAQAPGPPRPINPKGTFNLPFRTHGAHSITAILFPRISGSRPPLP